MICWPGEPSSIRAPTSKVFSTARWTRSCAEALKDGVPRPLTTRDLTAAAAEVKPSTREWFATARNHALFANQGGAYDDILKYLKQ